MADNELAGEQAYFDNAAKHRAQRFAGLKGMPSGGAHPAAAAQLKKFAEHRADVLGAADAVAFGRMFPEFGESRYIGLHPILDERAEVLVMSWKAPAAEPYFRASPVDPCGLVRKRTFRCTGNTIEDFTDVLFAEIATAVDRHLLGELARGRTGSMREIVATIQAAQFDIIRTAMDRLLVIEGGPGTGKTAVALHRVSWLLFHHADELSPERVLVVGPSPAFTRYIGTVLPELGDTDVVMRDIGQLAPPVQRGRLEGAPIRRLKGDARMAGLLSRALEGRIGYPEPAERLLVNGRFATLSGADVAAAVATCRAADGSYARRRGLLRDRLLHLVAGSNGAEPPRQVVDNLLERLWPQQSAASFLRDLLGSRERLRAAAADELSTDETALLYRRGADRLSTEIWSAADLPLLDEAENLINGTPIRYAHIVVDEAQDLSPMQLRSVARRSANGSMTVVGDLAQSTGEWARDAWGEVTAHLPNSQPITVTPLRYGYRVPRQPYALAQRLLPVAAPLVAPPEVVRDGPAEPQIHRVELPERAGRAVEVAVAHAAAGRFVGIVCPTRRRRELEQALADNAVEWSSADRGELSSSINLVSPQEAKGLEFDAVIVVEPEDIVAEDVRGHRLLYVALTRTTGRLDVVCVGEPVPLGQPPRQDSDDPDPTDGFTDADARRLAAHLAGRLRAAAPREAWRNVLTELTDLIDPA